MKNILVVRFSSLGDIVLTTGVIKYVKEVLKDDINIDFLTFTHFAGILSDFPYIRHIYCINKGATLTDLNNTIAQMPEYDYVIDLHKNTRSFFVKLIMSAKSCTYDKDSFTRRLFVKTKYGKNKLTKHTVEKYFQPFKKCFHMEDTDILNLKPYLPVDSQQIKSGNKVIIHPFASKKTKIWPFFSQLIDVLLEDGLDVTVIGDGTIDIPKGANNLTGKTSLQKLKNIISSGDLLITTDSGPMHIAAALNVPVLAIFGPTTKELGFYPPWKNNKVLEHIGLKCRPCHIHGSNTCPEKHFKCMLDIGAEEVRYHVNSILKKEK